MKHKTYSIITTSSCQHFFNLECSEFRGLLFFLQELGDTRPSERVREPLQEEGLSFSTSVTFVVSTTAALKTGDVLLKAGRTINVLLATKRTKSGFFLTHFLIPAGAIMGFFLSSRTFFLLNGVLNFVAKQPGYFIIYPAQPAGFYYVPQI